MYNPFIQSYTLPPDKLIQAVHFAHARYTLHFVGFAVSLLALALVIRLRVAGRLSRVSPPLAIAALLAVLASPDLPLDAIAHAFSVHYGISVESWPAWLWDWSKGQIIGIVMGVAVLWPFYWLIRRSPRRWWFYAWLAAVPLTVLSVYADPILLEPLFNQFEPLSAKHPELIGPIQQLLHRAAVSIPTDHLFEMEASQKTNSLNAYVSGFGPSRRVVLYDTIIRKENGPALLTTFGHELGHYVLNHIGKGILVSAAGLLISLYLAKVVIGRWSNVEIAALASLPWFLLFALILGFLSEPVINAYSRYQEHQADVYSLKITHGIVPNPGQAAAEAFQIEGETDLEEPSPNRFIVFWLYSHPPVADRLRFALEFPQ